MLGSLDESEDLVQETFLRAWKELGRFEGRSTLSVGGAGFASTLIELGLVDEYRLFINPIVLGGGTPYFPRLEQRTELELIETRTFGSRVVYARYGVLRRRVRDHRARGRAHR